MTDTDIVVLERPVAPSGDENDVMHFVCSCDRNVSLCGLDVTYATDYGDEETPEERDCVVCIDLLDTPCRRCGRTDG